MRQTMLVRLGKPMSARETAEIGTTVLYVEDDALTRDSVGQQLRRHGFRVIQADSGAKALELVGQASAPRAVLLDIELPGMDGGEVLRRLRQVHPHLGAVVYSANLTPQVRGQMEALGVDREHMLTKPCPFQDILTAIDDVLRNRGRFEADES